MKCDRCGRPIEMSAPMLRDAAWARLAERHEHLCPECFFQRAAERGVHLTLASLRPCPFNLFRRPFSWFDLFAKGESPADIAAWLDEAERGRERESHEDQET